MKFVWIGQDASGAAFVRAARTAGHEVVRLSLDAAPPPDGLETMPGVESFDQLSSLPSADAWILSGDIEGRGTRLRQVLRLEAVPLILAVPQGTVPEVYYELGLARTETQIDVLPLIEEFHHPALEVLGPLLVPERLGSVQWIEWSFPLPPDARGSARFMNGWHWLRELAGETIMVAGAASGESPENAAQIVVSARSERGVLSTIRWNRRSDPSIRLHIDADRGSIDCELPEGFSGSAHLRWTGPEGRREETVPPSPVGERWLACWNRLVAREESLSDSLWHEALRQIEIADGVERSLSRNRPVSLTQEELSEEAGFKSVMATTGCGLIWGLLLIAILVAAKVPYVHLLVLPTLILFALLQLFGLVYRNKPS